MSENYLDVPEGLKELDNIDLSTNRLSLGSEAKKKFKNYLWQFFNDAMIEDVSTEAAKRELEEYYIEKFMDVINGED